MLILLAIKTFKQKQQQKKKNSDDILEHKCIIVCSTCHILHQYCSSCLRKCQYHNIQRKHLGSEGMLTSSRVL